MKNTSAKQKKIIGFGLLLLIFIAIIYAGTLFVSGTDKATDEEVISSASVLARIPLSRHELDYMEEHPTIVVAADASWRPLEYVNDETGQYDGVIAEILERLEYYTGFEVKYKVMDSYAKALEEVQKGDADMVSGLANSQEMADEYNVNLSDPFLLINSAVVSKGALADLYQGNETKKIAVVDGDFANAEIEATINKAELVMCSSNEECLNKVKQNEVDMAIIASYCAEYYMSIPKYSSLKSNTVSSFGWELAFGVNKDVDPVLIGILNRAIAKMGELDLNEAVYHGIVNASYDNDWMIFVYKHPIFVIGGILGIVFLVGILLFSLYMARRRGNLRSIEDGMRLKLALERTHLCIWEIDLTTAKVTKINNEHEKHGFYELRDNIPESAIEKGYIHPDDVHLVREAMQKVVNGEQNVRGCWRVRELDVSGKDTVYWWEQVLFRLVYDERGRHIKTIGVSENVTREKNAQRDSLTLVYNRSSFEEKASRVLNERRNANLQCAFLILDLDGFKQINDTYGHDMGDRVLISIGATLNKTFRSTDIVGRLGGDEFTVFMTSICKQEDAATKAKELVENIGMVQERDGFPFPISCSVGVVVATKGEEELQALYKKADTALYEAKHAGKNQYKLYE